MHLGGIQHNLGWVAPRESRAPSTGARDNLTLDIGKHSPVDPKAGDVVADNLADQRRIVLIGRPFAAPFLWIPTHSLCAAPKALPPASPI